MGRASPSSLLACPHLARLQPLKKIHPCPRPHLAFGHPGRNLPAAFEHSHHQSRFSRRGSGGGGGGQSRSASFQPHPWTMPGVSQLVVSVVEGREDGGRGKEPGGTSSLHTPDVPKSKAGPGGNVCKYNCLLRTSFILKWLALRAKLFSLLPEFPLFVFPLNS